MTRNRLALPSLAMPWGRWVEENEDSTTALIESIRGDVNSAGSQFAARSDNLMSQVAAIPSLANIQQRELLPESVTRAFSPTTVGYVYSMSPITFNPPRQDRVYNYMVIANVVGTGVPMPYSRSLLRVNGIDFMYSHENQQASEFNTGTYSIAGSGTLGMGDTVTAEPGLISQSPGTMALNATLWCMFTGSIV